MDFTGQLAQIDRDFPDTQSQHPYRLVLESTRHGREIFTLSRESPTPVEQFKRLYASALHGYKEDGIVRRVFILKFWADSDDDEVAVDPDYDPDDDYLAEVDSDPDPTTIFLRVANSASAKGVTQEMLTGYLKAAYPYYAEVEK